MATTTARVPGRFDRTLLRPLGALATAGILTFCGLAIAAQVPSPSLLFVVAVVSVIALAAWMLFSERYAWSLAVLMLYLGLVDGYLKLRTGSSSVTLVRDLMLYAIAAGFLVRAAVRRESLKLPPLTGWVIAWFVVVAVQLANPGNGTLLHSVASVRPHIEWVPLFFFGYAIFRSKARLRNFLMLLLVIAAVNGVVGFIQLNLTPEQLSAWGPGYEKALNGESSVAQRTFTDEEGELHTRPFALGGDFGFGGIVGMIAIPAALALLSLTRRAGPRFAIGLLAAGAVLGVATSEARTAVIGSVVVVLAFAALTVTSRTGLRTVFAVALAVLVAYVTVGYLGSNTKQGSFDRYNSISSPSEALSTSYDYRKNTLAKIPDYAAQFPLGAGIGSNGPAASFSGGTARRLDAESEFNFLLIEVGLPGLAVMLGFNLTLLYLSITRIRRIADREVRLLLTAFAAPLFAFSATWFVGIATAASPAAPYLWLTAGVLSFWLLGERERSRWR